ncbi:hypothetical protein THASP1DRAFT_26771 [Thamnocephalis sphaerospora]|uniref:Uncharacterized protein n=1 Tax=Thamnocephalis sphaerospora TaxID=78915 RepID=A0A4P9XG89_9FUNG|nr:hypothetical protein THASP1DRAFT_26771 [Thamnocephalis sphaerospora]|eukprot:RKP04636.1 hypothetical protein THASP1DRAFT_26771 [Thamnocephalis sphaerospora]
MTLVTGWRGPNCTDLFLSRYSDATEYKPYAGSTAYTAAKSGAAVGFYRLHQYSVPDADFDSDSNRRSTGSESTVVHPLPHIYEIFDSLAGASCFSAIDLIASYWQVPIQEAESDFAENQ